jgi:CubicO group peptidase (beta-lactamase class C family)
MPVPTRFRTFRALMILAAGSGISGPGLAGQGKEPWPGLDAYVEAALKTWKVPGLGLAVVRNDSVIYARGYGVRDIGRPDKVDERTVFAIGSSSKAFTSAAVAMLVDEKRPLDANPGSTPGLSALRPLRQPRNHGPRPAEPPERTRPG